MDRIRALAVAGGGTGGHLFPGIALAEEFRRRDRDVGILYIGVAGKMEEKVIPSLGWDFFGLSVEGLKGVGPRRQIAAVLRAARAAAQCRSVLSNFRPDILIGVGGYSSGPAALAAWTLSIPVVLQEQNTVPGLTNRILGRLARRIFLAFEEASAYFPRGRAVVIGNPIRESALAEPAEVGRGERVRVLVLGGSRGARGINSLVGSALSRLGACVQHLEFLHQSGAEDHERVERAYREAGVRAKVLDFIEDVGSSYSWADLVVSRAGAGAVSEIAANGLPAVLVPFPHAANDHQRKNARWLVESGGAEVVEEAEEGGAAALADILRGVAEDRRRIREMASRSLRAGRRDAAQGIVTECYRLLGIQRG